MKNKLMLGAVFSAVIALTAQCEHAVTFDIAHIISSLQESRKTFSICQEVESLAPVLAEKIEHLNSLKQLQGPGMDSSVADVLRLQQDAQTYAEIAALVEQKRVRSAA